MPDNFQTMSTDEKMEYLMETITPDSLAVYIYESAMGNIYNSHIEPREAIDYAYINYTRDEDQAAFYEAQEKYKSKLSLADKLKLFRATKEADPEEYSYYLGLKYVGEIREQGKQLQSVNKEIENFAKECKSDPEFYKRFIKGFKTALQYDRGHDLDETIYTQFISYPDSIQ